MTLGPRGSRLLSPGSRRRQPPNRRVATAKALTGRTQSSVSVGNHTGTYSPTCRRTRPAVDCGDLNCAPRRRGLCSFPLRRAPSWVRRACRQPASCLSPRRTWALPVPLGYEHCTVTEMETLGPSTRFVTWPTLEVALHFLISQKV